MDYVFECIKAQSPSNPHFTNVQKRSTCLHDMPTEIANVKFAFGGFVRPDAN